jgi:lipopolysaccharide transport system ATP-binding protein
MKVRLAFAVAAHLEPEILIIDEVLAVGDMEFQKKCLGKMKQVSLGGRTVLFVSHNMAAIESLCGTGVHLEQGRIAHLGEISGVVSAYQSHAIRRLGSAHREFEGARIFRRVEVLDGNMRPAAHVPVGQELRLRITIDADSRIVAPRLYVGIDDLLGHRLLTLQPPIEFEALNQLTRRTVVECIMPNFPLAPGSYIVNLAMLENRQIIEHLRECGTITVVNAPLYEEGRGFERGVCVARAIWTRVNNFNEDGIPAIAAVPAQ